MAIISPLSFHPKKTCTLTHNNTLNKLIPKYMQTPNQDLIIIYLPMK